FVTTRRAGDGRLRGRDARGGSAPRGCAPGSLRAPTAASRPDERSRCLSNDVDTLSSSGSLPIPNDYSPTLYSLHDRLAHAKTAPPVRGAPRQESASAC